MLGVGTGTREVGDGGRRRWRLGVGDAGKRAAC